MSSIKIRSKRQDGYTEVRMLISHPMENGRNRDESGALIAAHFIQELTIKRNDKVVVFANFGASVAQDPFFTFKLVGGEPGDKIDVVWIDNQGEQDSEQHFVK